MEKGGWLDKIKGFLRKENNLQLAIAGVAAVALLVTIFSTSFLPKAEEGAAGDSAAASAQQQTSSNTDTLADRLANILNHVSDAGEVKVFIAYASGPEIVPAMSVDTQKSTTEGGSAGSESHSVSTTENSQPVVVQGKNGSEPMVLTQKEPEVLGVLVVAEGASKLEVRLRLAAAVQVALQLPANRIEVLPMEDTSNHKEGP